MISRRQVDIRTFARDLRVAMRLDTTNPIPPDMLLSRLEGSVVEDLDEGDLERWIAKRQRRGFILHIRKNLGEIEKRYSITHSLGHLFLHMGHIFDQERWKNEPEYKDSVLHRFAHSVEEFEAEEFLGEFLMPEERFRHEASEYTAEGKCSIQPLAAYFGVSPEVATRWGRSLEVFIQPL